MSSAAWEALTEHLSTVHTLSEIRAALAWDQQTYMPPKAAAARGVQSALLGQLAHERLVDPRVGEWLDAVEASGDLTDIQRAGIRNLRREYDRAVKVPADLVRRTGLVTTEAFGAWLRAKEERDFGLFAPHLAQVVELVRERAACIDESAHPYDVLLEEFDPGTTLSSLRGTFGRLAEGLAELIGAIGQAEPMPALQGTWDRQRQLALHRQIAVALGYDLQGGRLDEAEHPFTITLGTGDVRITTHVYEHDLLHGLSGTIHETGHALYEQGLPRELRDAGVGTYASLGLHESQSRFWENFIGGSEPFHRWLAGLVGQHFPSAALTADQLFRAANRVQPGLIRIAADEVTYNLHIIVRFELEVALMEGALGVHELRDAWNDRYQTLLGVTPAHDAEGVLQDVHWSNGMIGYFPSYTLGNLYAASLGAALVEARPSLWDEVAAGDFAGVLGWLRENVHRKGHLLDAPEIVRQAVGERDAVDDLLTHLRQRHGRLYGVC